MRTNNAARALLAAVFTVGLVLSGSAAAQADPPASDAELIAIGSARDIEAASTLTAAEQARLVELSQVASVEVSETSKPSGTATVATASDVGIMSVVCVNNRRTLEAYNATGNVLYKRWIEIRVCGDGGISSHGIVSDGGTTHWLGWSFDGRIGIAAGIVSGEARHYVQHHFRYSILQYGTIQNSYPCTSLDSTGVTASGMIVIKVSPNARCGLS